MDTANRIPALVARDQLADRLKAQMMLTNHRNTWWANVELAAQLLSDSILLCSFRELVAGPTSSFSTCCADNSMSVVQSPVPFEHRSWQNKDKGQASKCEPYLGCWNGGLGHPNLGFVKHQMEIIAEDKLWQCNGRIIHWIDTSNPACPRKSQNNEPLRREPL